MFGTGEPRLPELSDKIQLWSDDIRKAIDPERIHNEVVALPAPRNRIDYPEAMLQADAMILERLSEAGWAVKKYPFVFENIKGIEDTSPVAERSDTNRSISTSLVHSDCLEPISPIYGRGERI
ncbi:hypothetical protein ACFLTB_06105 [Chloroflexota bacterium]